ncbi:MAG: B12-binding domain-containing radical SAM protein [Fibrobacterota bacterium]
MRFLLVYPRWPKLPHQTEFNLPPHGPVVMAACIPNWVEVTFIDDNVQQVPFDKEWDFVGISTMLSAQLPRAFEIAEHFTANGTDVIFGGIAAMLHRELVARHCTSLFLGEAEGRLEQVFEDKAGGGLKPLYDYFNDFPQTSLIGPARRSILDYSKYEHKGVRLPDLFHASRGCRYNCFPCCTAFLGGRQFRPRPMDQVVGELQTIESDRLFIVDNSLAQDTEWEKELFRTIAPFKKFWCSHPIEDDDEVLELAYEAGAWYVYQAIFDTSDFIRNRIKRYKSHGIGVEGTIILGTDDQDEDSIKRLIDFLLEVELDLAEFTILTPFAHTPIRAQMEKDNRILTSDLSRYTAGDVVFEPKQISPQKLQDLYHYAWESFYRDEPQAYKMYRLFSRILARGAGSGERAAHE